MLNLSTKWAAEAVRKGLAYGIPVAGAWLLGLLLWKVEAEPFMGLGKWIQRRASMSPHDEVTWERCEWEVQTGEDQCSLYSVMGGRLWPCSTVTATRVLMCADPVHQTLLEATTPLFHTLEPHPVSPCPIFTMK